MAGITDWPTVDAQEERGIIRDSSGRPSGVLLEAGMEVMERAVAERVPFEDKLQMLKAATRYLNSFGITSVVVSQDPFTVPPETIAQTRAVMTMVAGKVVYERSP